MEILRYERRKLWEHAFFAAVCVFFSVMFFLVPEIVSRPLLGRLLFGHAFGHFILVPLMAGYFLVLLWRTIVIALGDRVAIKSEAGDLVVRTLYRTVRMPMCHLAPVEATQARRFSKLFHTLVFRSPMGGVSGATTVRLPLAMTAAHESGPGPVLAAIEQVRTAGIGPLRTERQVFDPHVRTSFGRKAA